MLNFPHAGRLRRAGRTIVRPPLPRNHRIDIVTTFSATVNRVIHAGLSPAEAKTQVFTHRYSDHFRNRLTHTLEVSQIARTVAAQLGLNVDLVQTLALVHDVGHPPFGHAGEKVLDTVMRQHWAFF